MSHIAIKAAIPVFVLCTVWGCGKDKKPNGPQSNEITIVSPRAGATITPNDSIIVTTDGSGVVSSIEFFINGELVYVDVEEPWRCPLALADVTNGMSLAVQVRATYSDGEVESSNVVDRVRVVPDDTNPIDSVAPAAIEDLVVTRIDGTSIGLRWGAVGDDSLQGQASSYVLRYSRDSITEENWNAATAVANQPTPSTPGVTDSVQVSELMADTKYFFAIRTRDEVANESGLSNVVSAKTPFGWSTRVPGAKVDECRAVVQTSDGGYLMVGQTNSTGAGGFDMLIAKVSGTGVVEWQRAYGDGENNAANDVAIAPDGSIWVVGRVDGRNGSRSNQDAYVLKLSSGGQLIGSPMRFGEIDGDDSANAVVATPDGGCVIVGSMHRAEGDRDYDVWSFGLSSQGTLLWQQFYGSDRDDYGNDIVAMPSGGYAIAGMTRRPEFDGDALLLTIASNGDSISAVTYGGNRADIFESIALRTGGFVMAGMSKSAADVSGDGYIVLTDAAGNYQSSQTYDRIGRRDDFYDVISTDDGGYMVAGLLRPSGGDQDAYILKVDASLQEQWRKLVYSGADDAVGTGLVRANSRGYVVGLSAEVGGSGKWDAMVAKLNENGEF